jgi:Xaa-Pro aminopeptidase
MLDLTACKVRLERLLAVMQEDRLDTVVLGNPKTIYYFVGSLVDSDRPQALVVRQDGSTLLATNREPEQTIAGDVRVYTAYTLDRAFLRSTMNAEAAEAVRSFARGVAAVEYEFTNAGITAAVGAARNITPRLEQMRRPKDADEIREFRAVIELAEEAYAAARRTLAPGMTELDAYLAMYSAVCRRAGHPVEFRGDFACGTRAINGGGPPTTRPIEAGDLYILDLFPAWQGYNCDLCRTFAVTEPAELQMRAWERVMDAHRLAQSIIRPGVRCRDVYHAIRERLDASFTHHAGHGVGMDAWEYPWLNAGTDQVIVEGEILAVEPGLYSEGMQGGIRLEHNYLVGRDDATALDTYPLELGGTL